MTGNYNCQGFITLTYKNRKNWERNGKLEAFGSSDNGSNISHNKSRA